MKVIGAGFGRTGTLSLRAALDRLGFGPCYHMLELAEHPEHIPQWLAAARGEPVDWRDLFAGYQSTMDWPACSIWAELAVAFPDAKVVLNTRDPQRWYASVQRTFVEARRHAEATGQTPPAELAGIFQLVMHDTFDGEIENQEHAIAAFERHRERVRHTVPRERLLVYELGQGWEPLCTFLGVDPPAEPFPHLNDSASFPQVMQRLAGLAT